MASHRRVRGRCGLVRATGLVCATVAAAGLAPTAVHADPLAGNAANSGGAESPAAVRQQVADLYQQAEAATQAYDAAEERIARLQAAVAGSGAGTARLRGQLAAATDSLGRLAAEQYRDAGLSPTMALVFSAHPDSYLEWAGLTERMAEVERQRLLTALSDQRALDSAQRESAAELADLHSVEAQLAARRAEVEAKLTAARTRLDSLSSVDRRVVTAALAHGDGDGLGTAATVAAPSLGSLLSAITTSAANAASAATAATAASAAAAASTPDAPPVDSSRAVRAVAAAYSALGKPYVWGATGPGEFDCSGLTQHAWESAGVQLPRTSQEQANAGSSVPVTDIKPGDLVVYFSGRTHVGIYVGKGLVIHAPRPGAVVQFAPLNSMPINKVIRPAQ